MNFIDFKMNIWNAYLLLIINKTHENTNNNVLCYFKFNSQRKKKKIESKIKHTKKPQQMQCNMIEYSSYGNIYTRKERQLLLQTRNGLLCK